jgi:hypothetical protein
MTIIPLRVAVFADRLGPWRVAAALAPALLMWSHDALAKGKPPKAEDQSAVAQYRESIPTSSGPSLEGSGATRTTPLPPPVRATITREAGRKAARLVELATSSAYGAPQERLPRISDRIRPAGAGTGSAIAAAPGRLLESAGRGRLLALLVVLAALTGGAAVAAGRRRRMTRRLVDFEDE